MFWYKVFWIISLIVLLIIYILGKSKHLIGKIYFQLGLRILISINIYKENGSGVYFSSK